MTVNDQNRVCAEFFQSCMNVFATKEREYAPEDIPLLDVLESAVDENTTIMTVLRMLHRKHVTATRNFDLHGHVTSDHILDRFRDIANYQALQVFYITHQRSLHQAWAAHWDMQPCHCALNGSYVCPRCLTLRWVRNHPPSFEASR